MAEGLHVSSKRINLVDRYKPAAEKSSDSGFADDDGVRSIPSGSGTPRTSSESIPEKLWRLPRATTDLAVSKRICYGKVISPKTASPRPIINDLISRPLKRENLIMHNYAMSPESLLLPDDNSSTLERSNSYESLVSGVSGGTAASEERKSVLQCVRSFSSLSAKDTKSVAGSVYSEPVRSTKQLQNVTGGGNQLQIQQMLITPQRSRVEFDETACSARDDESAYYRKQHAVRRMSSKNFDSDLEKSQTYLHGQSKHFSKSSQYLTPARPGLHKLQICYTQTNTENNHLVIFADLIRTSHRKNHIIEETVHNLERRLRIRRSDPNRSTSFYINKGIKDPIRTRKKSPARTIAAKKKERIERIKKTTEELKLGYVPTAQTVKPPTREEVEALRECRYLRVDPKVQDFSVLIQTKTSDK